MQSFNVSWRCRCGKLQRHRSSLDAFPSVVRSCRPDESQIFAMLLHDFKGRRLACRQRFDAFGRIVLSDFERRRFLKDLRLQDSFARNNGEQIASDYPSPASGLLAKVHTNKAQVQIVAIG